MSELRADALHASRRLCLLRPPLAVERLMPTRDDGPNAVARISLGTNLEQRDIGPFSTPRSRVHMVGHLTPSRPRPYPPVEIVRCRPFQAERAVVRVEGRGCRDIVPCGTAV